MGSRYPEWDGEEAYPNAGALWMRACENALHGKRGRAVLEELRAALLALPEKRLIAGAVMEHGQVCAMGALARYRFLTGRGEAAGAGRPIATLEELEAEVGEVDWDVGMGDLGERMGMSRALAWYLGYINDEDFESRTPEDRYDAFLAMIQSILGPRAEGGR